MPMHDTDSSFSKAKWHITIALLLAVHVGCASRSDSTHHYGVSQGAIGRKSLLGTATLAQMFRDAQWHVAATNQLSERIKQRDVIVWCPESGIPEKAAVEQLELWLASRPGRTLVYVHRAYSAELDYWENVSPQVEQDDDLAAIEEHRSRLIAARTVEYLDATQAEDRQGDCVWFSARPVHCLPQQCQTLRGTWSRQIDPAECGIRWTDRLLFKLPTLQRETLLAHDDIPIVTRLWRDDWQSSQILVLSHSAMWVNVGLANREHRLIARELISHCGRMNASDRKSMAFLETEGGEILLNEGRPSSVYEWPINLPLWHATAFGIALCAAHFRFLGRPRPGATVPAADFGRHVEALGELLAKTGASEFAQQRVDQYRSVASQESK
jgi:hypothetical protein